MNVLQDQVAIVTGAAQGLGFAIAKRFAEEGARVLLADLNAEAVARAAESLGQLATVVDVARREDCERMVALAAERLGPVDVLVNNAGIYRNTPLLELGEQEFDRIMAVNVKSALFAIQAVAPQMIARRSGLDRQRRLGGGSDSARHRDDVAYCVSKAGVAQLTNVAAIELAPHNVRVNADRTLALSRRRWRRDAYADPRRCSSRILPRITDRVAWAGPKKPLAWPCSSPATIRRMSPARRSMPTVDAWG